MSQMDLAGGIMATRRAKGRTATIAVDNIFSTNRSYHNTATCYADVILSITIYIKRGPAHHYLNLAIDKVTEGFHRATTENRPRPTNNGGRSDDACIDGPTSRHLFWTVEGLAFTP